MRLLFALLLALAPLGANAMSVRFNWGDTPACRSGHPKKIANPVFKLKGVPDGTVKLRFKMVDLQVPKYRHGGGKADYSGKNTIPAGAFRYKGPCPPNGAHTYEWRVDALNGKGKVLGSAKASRKFPQ